MSQFVLRVEVGHESFQLPDVQRLPFLAQHAVALTLFLVGTYATAHGRQVALAADNADGVAQVALRQLMYPVGYVVADGASLLTLRHPAVQAALCFVYGLGHRVALVYLLKCMFLIHILVY